MANGSETYKRKQPGHLVIAPGSRCGGTGRHYGSVPGYGEGNPESWRSHLQNYPPSRKETYRKLRSRKASSICWTTLPLGLAASMDCLVSEGRAPDGQEPTGSLRTTGGSGHTQKMCGLWRRAWGACQARFCCISSPWVLWGRRRPQEEEGCSTLRRALQKAWVTRGAGELGGEGRL